MANIRAVIFDSDGTLFNSFELINEAYNHVAKIHGLHPPTSEDVLENLRQARPIPEILGTLFPGQDISILLETKYAYFSENALKISGYEGLHDLLEELTQMELKLAILTSGGHKIHELLKVHELEHYFASVVHGERVHNHKPHPEGFNLAVKECGVSANEAIMVGDSHTDIITGRNADAYATIGITHGNGTLADLQQADADYIVSSLTEIVPLIKKIQREGLNERG